MCSRSRKIIFFLFLLWIFVSALYYAPNLLSGELLADRSEGIFYKAIKYFMAIGFSVVLFLAHRSHRLIAHWIGISVFLLVMFLYEFSGYAASFGVDALLVLLAFVGLAHAATRFNTREINSLSLAVILSGFFISCVSYVEFLYFEPILGDYWRRTGGFRSVSTLLNPNNLGLYLGASIILIIINKPFRSAILYLILFVILGAFLLSGSRTAWVSAFLVLSFCYVYRGNFKFSQARSINYLAFLIFIGFCLTLVFSFDFPLPDRAGDFYTADLRLQKYVEYIAGFDASYFFPDFSHARVDVVSESGYFHLANSLGLMWFGMLLVWLVMFSGNFKFREILTDRPQRAFDAVLLYYVIAMVFENVIMSFPNNQLMFVTFGVVAARLGRQSHRFVHGSSDRLKLDIPVEVK